jgi:hypothetical protein
LILADIDYDVLDPSAFMGRSSNYDIDKNIDYKFPLTCFLDHIDALLYNCYSILLLSFEIEKINFENVKEEKRIRIQSGFETIIVG